MKLISDATRAKMRESALRRDNSVYAGKTPWNKGKRASDDPRVAKYAEKQQGQKRTGNYGACGLDWKGENNPWFGKSRSGPDSPRYNPETRKREYLDYKHKVAWLTELTYREHNQTINPEGYTRTLAGVEGGYQLDHIIPVSKAYRLGMTAEEVASVRNLQMLPWETNREKSDKVEFI